MSNKTILLLFRIYWNWESGSKYVYHIFYLLQHPVVSKSLSCLKESTSDLNNTYTAAMLAYVFTMAGDMETRAQLLEHLDKVALHDGEL